MTAEEVVSLVRNAVSMKQPLSIVRLGDGESRLMGWPKHSTRDDLELPMVRWFGRTDLGDDELHKLADGLRNSVGNADVVGVPRPDQRAADRHWANVERYMDAYDLRPLWVTNASVHRELQEQGLYQDLVGGVETVFTITCRDIGEQLAEAWDRQVVYTPIPGEGFWGPTPHWPRRFKEVWGTLDHPQNGRLWLVGAGLLGKLYCDRIKQSGGVAVDIGSTFDGWAGMKTRGYIAKQPEVYAL